MHHHGKRVSEAAELKRLEVNHPVWEWTRTPVGRGQGSSTIYGPYSTDFPEPGLYSASFRIKGTGFSRPEEIISDVILLELDVNKTMPQYDVNERNIAMINAQYKIAKRYVRVSELAQKGWIDFKLKFWSDAQGIWEYRIFAHDGENGQPDNISRFGSEVRIVFDTIAIQKLNNINFPWA